AFRGDRGDDHRNSQSHALVHLALHARSESNGCHRDPCSIEDRLDVGNIPKDLDVRACELLDLRSGIRTDDLEYGVRYACGDPGKNLPRKVEDRIHVRGMIEAADEEDVAAAFETRNIGPVDRDDVRNDPDIQPRTLLLEDVYFDRADHQGQIGAPRQAKLLPLATGTGRLESRVLHEPGLAFFPEKVKVHRVKHDPGSGGQAPDGCQVPRCDAGPRD